MEMAYALRPGGMISITEMEFTIYAAPSVRHRTHSAITHYFQMVAEAAASRGSDVTAPRHLQAMLHRSEGQFENVEQLEFWMPVVPAPGTLQRPSRCLVAVICLLTFDRSGPNYESETIIARKVVPLLNVCLLPLMSYRHGTDCFLYLWLPIIRASCRPARRCFRLLRRGRISRHWRTQRVVR